MARVDLREVENVTGTVYDATKLKRVYAEDHNGIKGAIDDATVGINTKEVEVGGVEVIDSSGDVKDGTGVVSHKDKKQGSDCTGSDGDQNRILTLTNTKTTQNVIVMVSGTFLVEDQDYTPAHNATSSTITFLNRLADTQYIEVIFFS